MWPLELLRDGEFRREVRIAVIGFFILTPIAVGTYAAMAPIRAVKDIGG
jgi:hypothetical protein